jgi:hypothetical protein
LEALPFVESIRLKAAREFYLAVDEMEEAKEMEKKYHKASA